MEKYWLEQFFGVNNASQLGMSSALGCTKEDLPTNVKPGSVAFDYTTQTLYTFDGVSWR